MKLSQAELDTMMYLWECEEPIRPAILLKTMEKTHDWSISTLKTILTRLEEKGVVSSLARKRFFYYFPSITKNEYFSMEAQDLVNKMNASSPLPIMIGLMNSDSITENDLDEIEKMLAETKKRLKTQNKR